MMSTKPKEHSGMLGNKSQAWRKKVVHNCIDSGKTKSWSYRRCLPCRSTRTLNQTISGAPSHPINIWVGTTLERPSKVNASLTIWLFTHTLVWIAINNWSFCPMTFWVWVIKISLRTEINTVTKKPYHFRSLVKSSYHLKNHHGSNGSAIKNLNRKYINTKTIGSHAVI